jgi:hypothetical protein
LWLIFIVFLVLSQGIEEKDAARTRLLSNGQHFQTTGKGKGIYGHCTANCFKCQECLSAGGASFSARFCLQKA